MVTETDDIRGQFHLDRAWLAEAERLAGGDAFYIFNPQVLRRNIEQFSNAVRAHYANTRFAHSYKTNFTPALVKIADELGLYSEVVSRQELAIALRLGIDPENILFNGPLKTRDDLSFALNRGIGVNADSLHELGHLLSVASEYPEREFTIGLRLGFDLSGSPTRFGIDLESGDFRRACEKVEAAANVHIGGLHCHFSVGDRNVEAYQRRVRRLIEAADSVGLTENLQFLDVGGGFAGRMSPGLRREFSCNFPDYDEYAAAVGGEMAAAFGKSGGPELILEPGMGVLADTMFFACRISHLKALGSRAVAFTSGSVFNIKPFLHKKNIPFRRIPADNGEAQPRPGEGIDITGYTCMEIDMLYRDYKGALAPGDWLVFENCGAYTTVLVPQFIRMPPAILSVGTDGSPKLIRRATEVEDALATYLID